MVKVKFKAKAREYKRLNAREVHRLVSEVLQEYLPLDMDGRAYKAADIWDVLIAAAVERLTIEGASEVLEAAPSPNTIRTVLRGSCPTRDWRVWRRNSTTWWSLDCRRKC